MRLCGDVINMFDPVTWVSPIYLQPPDGRNPACAETCARCESLKINIKSHVDYFTFKGINPRVSPYKV